MMDGQTMSGELYPEFAPETVDHFVKLCESHYYDGLVFHRVIEGFMIQGGGYSEGIYNGDFTEFGSELGTIKGEFSNNGVENELKHTRGVISMARLSNDNDSADSQFFIMHQDDTSLDGNYAAFGKITEGLDVVDYIAALETIPVNPMMKDVPEKPQMIKTIRIEK
ncbi:MAG: peptidylprolyl isomerase [Clostridia bacterium]|nr:peptidylprolyl isomerase [Clostridia bacterium]